VVVVVVASTYRVMAGLVLVMVGERVRLLLLRMFALLLLRLPRVRMLGLLLLRKL